MNKILSGFFMVLTLLLFALPMFGETSDGMPGTPCVDDWSVVKTTIITVEVYKSVSAYLCFEIEYQNPNNSKEFVRVVRRIIPLVPARYIKKSGDFQKDVDTSSFFVKKEEEDMVQKLFPRSDAILYMKWHMEKDLRTGTNVQFGKSEIWILNSDSNEWYFLRGGKVSVKDLSATIPGIKRSIAIVGREYSVGKDHYQILSIGPNELKRIGEKLNPKNKKGAGHEK